MICKEWLAQQRRILEQHGLIGEMDELEMLFHRVPLGNLRDVPEPQGNADYPMLQAL